jgi:endo-alpha-1,4-polygalactosaminidase (GH114 family)
MSPAEGELEVMNAIGVEDLFYHHCSVTDRDYGLRLLQQYSQAGIRIFNVEYVTKRKWPEYRSRVCRTALPIVPYAAAADRELDELVAFPPKPCPGVVRVEPPVPEGL